MRKHKPAVELASIEERLAALGPFDKGRIITIPLDLWPAYKERERLAIKGLSALGNLFVKQDARPFEELGQALDAIYGQEAKNQ